jgi:hypothetical protein
LKGKPRRSIDQIGSTSIQNPLAAATNNSTKVRILGFTLCTELQETIFSFQNECPQFATESSVLPDDSTHPMSVDDIQIITDPSIPEYPPCVLEEEQPVPPPATKKQTTTFISTLPRRKTRSTRSVKDAIGRQDMEKVVPILRPLFPMVDTETVPHESTVHVETDPQEPVQTDTTVTPELVAPQKIVVPKLVILEPTDNVEAAPQEPVLKNTDVPQSSTVHVKTNPQEPVPKDTTVTQESTPQHAQDVPLAQLFAQIEHKIKNTENARIVALKIENANLKAELKTLKQEVVDAQQKNPEGITMDILALTKVVLGRNKELMCFECGNIYYEVGYEVVKVLVATGPTNVSIKTEHGLPATQKSVKQRRSHRHKSAPGILEACKQEPLFSSQVVTQATLTDPVLKHNETQTDC